MNKEIKYVEQYENDWGRNYIGDKNHVCEPRVNDMGLIQCVDCLVLFNLQKNKKYIISCLKERHGSLWEKRYDELKEIRSLIRRRRFEKLRPVEYTFWEEGRKKIKTIRLFYEKADSD